MSEPLVEIGPELGEGPVGFELPVDEKRTRTSSERWTNLSERREETPGRRTWRRARNISAAPPYEQRYQKLWTCSRFPRASRQPPRRRRRRRRALGRIRRNANPRTRPGAANRPTRSPPSTLALPIRRRVARGPIARCPTPSPRRPRRPQRRRSRRARGLAPHWRAPASRERRRERKRPSSGWPRRYQKSRATRVSSRRVTLRGAPAKVRACSTARVSDETIEVHRVSDEVIEVHRVMRERECVDGEVSDLKSRGRTSAEKSSSRFSRSLSALSPAAAARSCSDLSRWRFRSRSSSSRHLMSRSSAIVDDVASRW